MAKQIIAGNQFLVELGGGKVGCASSVSFSATKNFTDAACRENGGFQSGAPGMKSASFTIDGIVIYDDPEDSTAVRAKDFGEAYMNDTLLPFVLGPGSNTGGTLGTPGDITYMSDDTTPVSKSVNIWKGNAYVESYDETGEEEGNMTYSVTFRVEGVFTYAPKV